MKMKRKLQNLHAVLYVASNTLAANKFALINERLAFRSAALCNTMHTYLPTVIFRVDLLFLA